jgi:CHAT domain-containing protein
MEWLRSFKPNIFHFIGHGVWHEDRPQLVIATDENRVKHMDEDMLRDLLRGQDDLKVVFLSACQSGDTQIDSGVPTEDSSWDEADVSKSLVGIAPELLKIGIPAVLAMQYSVRVDTARRFAFRFYKSLADDEDPIDAAVNVAREDLRLDAENRRGFGTPVLHTFIPRLFTVDLSLFDRIRYSLK